MAVETPRASRSDLDAIVLALSVGSRPAVYRQLRDESGGASAALAATDPAAREIAVERAELLLERCARLGAVVLTPESEGYPRSLDVLLDQPTLLFAIGDLSLLEASCVAIVGTRKASTYAERVARQMAVAIASAGGTVVSGMALGVDAAAHRGALETNGRTVAILGTGIDLAYPAAHQALHREVGARGLLLSEIFPGERGHGGAFPMRNRLIAALSPVVIVVEAPHGSGALITARHGLDLNQDVGVVPGRIDDVRCAGSNKWLREGAHAITSVTDALHLAGLAPAVGAARSRPWQTDAERAVWEALATGASDLESLAVTLGMPASTVTVAVTGLELAGAVACEVTGAVARR